LGRCRSPLQLGASEKIRFVRAFSLKRSFEPAWDDQHERKLDLIRFIFLTVPSDDNRIARRFDCTAPGGTGVFAAPKSLWWFADVTHRIRKFSGILRMQPTPQSQRQFL